MSVCILVSMDTVTAAVKKYLLFQLIIGSNNV